HTIVDGLDDFACVLGCSLTFQRFCCHAHFSLYFFFNDPAPTEIYTLSLHDALPIWRIDVDTAVARLRSLPYEDLGFAKVDHHRAVRTGAAEAVFCPGKTPEQVVAILARLARHHANVIATRAGADVATAVAAAGLPHADH